MAGLTAAELELGQALVRQGRLNRSQLLYAQRWHEVAESSFAGQLVRLGLVGDQDMGEVVAQSRALAYRPELPEGWPTAQALSLTRDELVTLAKNSFTGSFLPPEAVQRRLAEIDAYVAAN